MERAGLGGPRRGNKDTGFSSLGLGNKLTKRPRMDGWLSRAEAGSRCGETIGLEGVLSRHMRDREIERPGQLPADPIQGVESRAAAAVLASHLLDHHFGIRKHVKSLGLEPQRILQRFQQSNILGDIIVLAPYPFGNSDFSVSVTVNYNPNTQRPGLSDT